MRCAKWPPRPGGMWWCGGGCGGPVSGPGGPVVVVTGLLPPFVTAFEFS
jgi:hypothetical protein